MQNSDRNQLLEDKQLEIYIYVCLAQQLESFSYCFNGLVNFEAKHKLQMFQQSAKAFMRELSKSIPEEELISDAEIFTDALRLIKEAKGEKKKELFNLLGAWTKGQVKVEHAPEIETQGGI